MKERQLKQQQELGKLYQPQTISSKPRFRVKSTPKNQLTTALRSPITPTELFKSLLLTLTLVLLQLLVAQLKP